jgi:hypothetical protein
MRTVVVRVAAIAFVVMALDLAPASAQWNPIQAAKDAYNKAKAQRQQQQQQQPQAQQPAQQQAAQAQSTEVTSAQPTGSPHSSHPCTTARPRPPSANGPTGTRRYSRGPSVIPSDRVETKDP